VSVSGKVEANELLRFAIGVVLGEHGWKLATQKKYRIVLAQDVQCRLLDSGFEWQARIVGYWVNRCRRGDFDQNSCSSVRADLSPRERREVS
jgi:hypothetical protein